MPYHATFPDGGCILHESRSRRRPGCSRSTDTLHNENALGTSHRNAIPIFRDFSPLELDRPATSLAAVSPRHDTACAHDQWLSNTHARSLARSKKNETARSAAASAARAAQKTKNTKASPKIQKPWYHCTTYNNNSMRAGLKIYRLRLFRHIRLPRRPRLARQTQLISKPSGPPPSRG